MARKARRHEKDEISQVDSSKVQKPSKRRFWPKSARQVIMPTKTLSKQSIYNYGMLSGDAEDDTQNNNEDFISLNSPASSRKEGRHQREFNLSRRSSKRRHPGDYLGLDDSESSESSVPGDQEQTRNDPADDSFISFDFAEEDDEPVSNDVISLNETGDKPDRMANMFDQFEQEEALPVNSEYFEDNSDTKSRCPWFRRHECDSVAAQLSAEVADFVAYVSPSNDEIIKRNLAFKKISSIVEELWPDAKLEVFGSYASNMYLPGSDIDMVVISKSGRYDDSTSLYQLGAKLKSAKVLSKIEIISKTRVPIIKLVEKVSGIPIDISFEKKGGVQAVSIIRGWTELYPGLRELVLVVKQFLRRRHLNEVRSGGLGGFSIICLVTMFLANHPQIASGSMKAVDNLGVLLLEFFELYGEKFNYDITALDLATMKFVPKSREQIYYNEDRRRGNELTLAITDPADRSNNISRSSYNIRGLQKAFSSAFLVLSNRCYDVCQYGKKKRGHLSILGDVIQFQGAARDFEHGDEANTAYDKYSNGHSNVKIPRDRGKLLSAVMYDENADEDEEDEGEYIEDEDGDESLTVLKTVRRDEDQSNEQHMSADEESDESEESDGDGYQNLHKTISDAGDRQDDEVLFLSERAVDVSTDESPQVITHRNQRNRPRNVEGKSGAQFLIPAESDNESDKSDLKEDRNDNVSSQSSVGAEDESKTKLLTKSLTRDGESPAKRPRVNTKRADNTEDEYENPSARENDEGNDTVAKRVSTRSRRAYWKQKASAE